MPARFTSALARIYLDARWANLDLAGHADERDPSEICCWDPCSNWNACARLLASLAFVAGNSFCGGPMALLVNPIR